MHPFYLAKMLPEPILTVLTRVSRYQVQSKTSLHLTSRLPRAWHLPFCPKNECAIFRVHIGKNMSPSLLVWAAQPFQVPRTSPQGALGRGLHADVRLASIAAKQYYWHVAQRGLLLTVLTVSFSFSLQSVCLDLGAQWLTESPFKFHPHLAVLIWVQGK